MPITDDPPATAPTEPSPRRRLPVGPVGLLLITAVAAAVALGFLWLALPDDGPEPVRIQDALDSLDTGPAVPAGTPAAQVGATAPDVRLTYLDGGTQRLSELRGVPVVLNFWSSTCAPCLQEMPAMQQVAKAQRGKVAVVGVDVTDTEKSGNTMVSRTGVTYRNARDPKAEMLGVFNGIALPRTVLIDGAGRVVDAHNGALTAPELTALLHRNGLIG